MTGNQTPRIGIEPPRSGTDGEGAAVLMQAFGVTLDPWQKEILDCWLGKDAAGHYTVTSGGLSCPRQNGKNLVLECREAYGLLINGERILHTAHQVRTCLRTFRRLAAMFSDKSRPDITAAVKRIRYGVGEQSILLHNGGCIEFLARSRQAARGFDGISLVAFDEAQELEEGQLEALLAVLSASATGTRQLLYIGTPPYPGCPGDVFRRFRQSCIMKSGRGEASANSWHEWSISADSIADINVSDRALWYDANPALGRRLTVEFTAEECATLSPDGFARERLGWWAPPVAAQSDLAIDPQIWDACKSDDPKPEGKVAYGVKFSADGSEVCLCGAVVPKQGAARISLIAQEPTGRGISWLADWLNQRYKAASCVIVDGRTGADLLCEKLRDTWRMNGTVIKPSAKDIITAASTLLNELSERTVTWYSEQDELRASALVATRRPISGGFGFGGAGSSPIEAASLALWGARTTKRDPSRKMRIG